MSDDEQVALVANHLRAQCQTDEGMALLMDAIFGAGCWLRDEREDLWVAPEQQHTGPGRMFWCVRRGGSWFQAVLQDEITQ